MRNQWAKGLTVVCAGLFLGQFVMSSAQANSTQFKQLAQVNCSPSELSQASPPFRCITPVILRCLKDNNNGRGGSLDYKGNTSGEILVKSNVAGTVALLGFQFDESTQTLNLNVKRKNPALPEQTIWDGFRNTISQCRQIRRR